MFRIIVVLLLIIVGYIPLRAQMLSHSYVQEGEVGISMGAGHYFGDLNTSSSLNRPKFAAGIFFRKQFGNYVAVKLSGSYIQLGYSDVYSKNDVQRRRNLSFNSGVWELAISGEFNFFRFYPEVQGFHYTPYISMGAGIFSYDPYAYYNKEKYFLRPLGTEGQVNKTLYPTKTPYENISLCMPIAVGFKYSISPEVNLFAEASYRFTGTDYLDDVSTTYAGSEAFPDLIGGNPSIANLLQDRSYETGTPIGIKGRQRGNSGQADSYATFQVGVSLNLSSYKCPKP